MTYEVTSGGLSKITGSLFSSRPYATEQELIAGLVDNNQGLTAYSFNLGYHVAIEPREEATLTFDTAALPEEMREDFDESIGAAFAMGAIPAEVDIRVDAAGMIDARNEATPEFDVSVNFNMLAEPIIMRGAGSLRLADGVMYGKIDSIPANFENYLNGVPTEKWIILDEADALGLPADYLPQIQSQEVFNMLPPEVTNLLANEAKRLAFLPLQAAKYSRDFIDSQAAQLGATPFLNTEMGDEERLFMERSIELLKEYPIVSFVGLPQKTELNDEVVYEYELDLDEVNLEKYFIKLVAESEAIYGEVLPVTETELRASFAIMRPLIVEFNRLSKIVYSLLPDGTLAGVSINSLLTFDHPEVKQQFRFDIEGSMTRQDDGMDIAAPEDVYEKTMQEILEDQAEAMMYGCEIDQECGFEDFGSVSVVGSVSSEDVTDTTLITWGPFAKGSDPGGGEAWDLTLSAENLTDELIFIRYTRLYKNNGVTKSSTGGMGMTGRDGHVEIEGTHHIASGTVSITGNYSEDGSTFKPDYGIYTVTVHIYACSDLMKLDYDKICDINKLKLQEINPFDIIEDPINPIKPTDTIVKRFNVTSMDEVPLFVR